MTFFNKVLDELSNNSEFIFKNRLPFIYAILLFSKYRYGENFLLETENLEFLKIVLTCFKKEFNMDLSSYKDEENIEIYISSNRQRKHLTNELKKREIVIENKIDFKLIENKKESIAFLIGVILSCGFITDPLKSYHLEFFTLNEAISEDLLTFLATLGFTSKISKRKAFASSTVYMRNSTTIEEFLTYIGATKSTMEIIEIKMEKELRNNVNRTINFETANIGRTAKAYTDQMVDINYIINANKSHLLTKELKEIIDIRAAFPDASLKELGEKFSPPISRSAVNYRLKKIKELANSLRNGEV